MNRDFYSVSDFDSTFLPPVRYWIENFKKHQVLIYFFSEKKLFGILAFQKSFFSVVVFYSKNLKLSFFRLFPKNWFWGRFFLGKNILWIKIFEKDPLSIQLLYNASVFESIMFKDVKFWANFLQFVKIWIKVFIACQVLNHLSYYPSEFEWK